MTSGISRNYARAIFDLATEGGFIATEGGFVASEGGSVAAESSSLEAMEADLRAARAALFDDRETRDFLASRVVGRSTKRRLVMAAFEGKVDPRVLTLLLMVVERGRARLLGEIDDEFERLSRIRRGVRRATVLSAFPLGDEEKARIRAALQERYGGTVELIAQVRPGLIGGVLALSEGQEIEFTVEGQLAGMRHGMRGKNANQH